jgi:GH18 family chitinase
MFDGPLCISQEELTAMKLGSPLLRTCLGIAIASSAHAETAEPVLIGYAAVFRGLEASIDHPSAGRYTHINLAFANPDREGAMVKGKALVCFPVSETAMLTRKQLRKGVARLRARGSKVLVSVAGGVIPECSGDWAELLSRSKRSVTVKNLIALVDEAGLDGLDIDIEGTLLTSIHKAGDFTPFIAELSAELRRRGKLLTCATASYEGGMIPKESIPYFDLVNVMSYDAIGPSWGPAGAEHSPLEAAQRDLALWRERGVSKERLVLGVPFYGYGFGSFQSNWNFGDIAAAYGRGADRIDVIGKACAACSYITFNSPVTIRQKAELAAHQASGVMVWEISQDSQTGTLLEALKAGLNSAR